MSSRIAVAVMAALLLLYIALVAQRAWLLLGSGDPVGVAMGAVLVVLPIIAIWALARELWFGVRAEQLGRRLEAEGELPDDLVAVRPSGRVVRADGDALFPRFKADVESGSSMTRLATDVAHGPQCEPQSGSSVGGASRADR